VNGCNIGIDLLRGVAILTVTVIVGYALIVALA
jgi:hypothetical protein